MARLYLRQAIVEVSNQIGQTIKFNGLRTIYDVEKTIASSANKAKIEIWNLAESSRTFIEGTNEGETLKVKLDGGYVDFVERIFSGNIAKAKSVFSPPNWITTIEVGDGEKELRETTTDRNFPIGTPFQTIITTIAQSFGLAVGSQMFTAAGISRNGESYSEQSKTILDRLANVPGLVISVDPDPNGCPFSRASRNSARTSLNRSCCSGVSVCTKAIALFSRETC